MKYLRRTILPMLVLCLLSGTAEGQDLQSPFPFSAAIPPGTPPAPLLPPPAVQRLPPVGQSLSPMEWVAAPPPQEMLLEPTLEPAPEVPPPSELEEIDPFPLSPEPEPAKIK